MTATDIRPGGDPPGIYLLDSFCGSSATGQPGPAHPGTRPRRRRRRPDCPGRVALRLRHLPGLHNNGYGTDPTRPVCRVPSTPEALARQEAFRARLRGDAVTALRDKGVPTRPSTS